MDPRIARAVAGDRDALASLLMEHFDSLYAFVVRKTSNRVRSHVSPEDVLQNVFVMASKDIGSFNIRTEKAFENWLKTLADHQLTDMVKWARAGKRGGEMTRVGNEVTSPSGAIVDLLDQIDAGTSTPSTHVMRDEQIAAMLVHLGQLPAHYRQILELRYLDELHLAQICERLGKSNEQVKGLLERARSALHESLEGGSHGSR